MKKQILKKALLELEEKGLNLFSCILVKDIPLDIKDIFLKQKIILNEEETLCLIGHGGQKLWENLPHPLKKEKNPIDCFSIEEMKQFKEKYLHDEIQILFPHPTYIPPLQRLGRLLNLCRPSPLGIDISQSYGLWFGVRGLFTTKESIPFLPITSFPSPCDLCLNKDCISTCPAQALSSAKDFNASSCFNYQLLPQSNCATKCLARLACPYQRQHQYSQAQIDYHQMP